jgi:hypothetical protein
MIKKLFTKKKSVKKEPEVKSEEVKTETKPPITYTEVETKFKAALEEISPILDKHFGKDKHMIYLNLIWDQSINNDSSSYQIFRVLSKPTGDEKEKTYESMSRMGQSLYSDPFVASSVLHLFVNKILENMYEGQGKAIGNFMSTGPNFGDVN